MSDSAYEDKVKHCAVIAKPLAPEKLCKKVLKLCKRATKKKQVKRGVKEVVKAIRKKTKGCAASRSPQLAALVAPRPPQSPALQPGGALPRRQGRGDAAEAGLGRPRPPGAAHAPGAPPLASRGPGRALGAGRWAPSAAVHELRVRAGLAPAVWPV